MLGFQTRCGKRDRTCPGALLAIAAAHQTAAPGVMCLRGVNPYVTAALTDWGRRAGGAGPLVPRTTAPAAAMPAQDAITGVLQRIRSWHKTMLLSLCLHPSFLLAGSVLMTSCATWDGTMGTISRPTESLRIPELSIFRGHRGCHYVDCGAGCCWFRWLLRRLELKKQRSLENRPFCSRARCCWLRSGAARVQQQLKLSGDRRSSAALEWLDRLRRPGGIQRCQPEQAMCCAGTSSFGMSGVNAHMLLGPRHITARSLGSGAGLQWRRGRYWPSPFPHRLGRPDASDQRGIQR